MHHFAVAICVVSLVAVTFLPQPNCAATTVPRERRVLYNLDGDSCMTRRADSKGPVSIRAEDLRQLVREVAYEGSRVDTVLVCVNAQVMYYPTKVGTLRGATSTPEERAKWSVAEQQRFENMQRFFAAGIDPYAVILGEARKQGREALISFRVNDAHGNDFLRTQFWIDHADCRLASGALDIGRDEVRDYVYALVEEAARRYDCDGLELDFNRFPNFFSAGTTDERVAKMNTLVQRIRRLLDEIGNQRGRRLVLAARVPSNFGRTPPSYSSSCELGCDVVAWAKNGWLDVLTVSEFLWERYDLPIKPWKELIGNIPIYGGIECTEGPKKGQYLTADKYQRAAERLRRDGADGIYLFNFFTTREYDADAWEPPFQVLKVLGSTNQ